MFMNSVIDLTAYLPEQPAPRRRKHRGRLPARAADDGGAQPGVRIAKQQRARQK